MQQSEVIIINIYYWVISLKIGNKRRRIPESVYKSLCWVCCGVVFFSFFISLKASQKEFPRAVSVFTPHHMWACAAFPSWSGKRSPQVVQGASASAAKGKAGRQQHWSCRKDLGEKVCAGSKPEPLDPRGSLELGNHSPAHERIRRDRAGSSHCPPCWIMLGKPPGKSSLRV